MQLRSNSGNGVMYMDMDNEGGLGLFGSGNAYGACMGTPYATSLNLATSNLIRLKISSNGEFTFHTGQNSGERATITNDHTTIKNLLVVEGTPQVGVGDSPIFRLSGSEFEPTRMILSPSTFVKIYEPDNAFEDWNGLTVQNVLNLPVACNVLIQGYMSFYTNTQSIRAGIVRLTHLSTGTTYFVEAIKFFNIIQSHECVPINEVLYNLPAGSWNMLMFTTPGALTDFNDRAFISATVFT